MAQQYEQQIQHVEEGERVITAADGIVIAQTPDGAVAITADARIALGPASHAACCWRDDQRACAVALTDDEGSPRHRVAFVTTKGLVDTVECGPSVAPHSHVVGAAFRTDDGALGVLYGDGALRVALLGLEGGRVVEEAACVSKAAAAATALAVVGDRFAVGAADGSCAVVKAKLCAVLGQATIARDLDLPANELGEPVTALAATDRWLFVAAGRSLRWWDARTGAPVSAFRAPAALRSLCVVLAAPDSATTTWVLAAADSAGATATLSYDRACGMAVQASPAVACAGVAPAQAGFVAFGPTAVRKFTAKTEAAPERPTPPPCQPTKAEGAAALEAALHAVVASAGTEVRAAQPLAALFAAAPADAIAQASKAVVHAPYASQTQARAALDAAIEGLLEETDDDAKVSAERYLQTTQRRLDVFGKVLRAAERCGSTLDASSWGRAWARFRDGDAGAHAKEACERGHAHVAAVLWRELRFDDGDARTRGAAARARADARAVKCVEVLPTDAPVQAYVGWVFGEVAPALAGGALGRLAAWAAGRARALEADGRLDDALLIAREAHDAIGDRSGVGAVATGGEGDAWLADAAAADARRDVAELRSALERVAALRDAHGVDAQLGEYEACDKASLARRLLDRVEKVDDVASHVEEHVRPVCREHDVDADDILTSYITARAEQHTQVRNSRRRRLDEAASDQDELAFAVAALDEVDDDAKRTAAALTILTAARAPFSDGVIQLAHRPDLLDTDAAVDESARGLADAARLVRLAHLAHRHRVRGFDAGNAAHARFLLRRITSGAWRLRRMAPRDALRDATTLARAYPATLSRRDAVVAFARGATRPEFYDDEAQAEQAAEAADAAVGVARRALRDACAAGAERRSARREVVAYCLRVLDGGDDGAQLNRRELAACAQLGAGVAVDLAEDVGGARRDDDASLRDADAKARKGLDTIAACQRSLEVWDCTSYDLRDAASSRRLLQRVADRAFGRADDRTVKAPTADAVATVEKLAALLEAPPGWTACRVALQAAVDDARVAESLKQADAAASKGRGDPAALRDVAEKLATNLAAVDLWSPAGDARRAAAYRLRARCAAEAGSAQDCAAMEVLRFVDAVRARCAGAPAEISSAGNDDGLLLQADEANAPLRRFVLVLREAHASTGKEQIAAKVDDAADGLVAVFRKTAAWRLAARALTLRDAAVARHRTEDEPGARRRGHVALGRLKALLDAAEPDAELCVACALAAPPKKAFDAYRGAVGTCGGSAAELDRLALLATVGEAVAARLDDGALEHASRSLAHDAVWWRFLKRRGVAFDHARLCLQASPTTVNVGDILRRSASHATELLPAVLDAVDPDDGNKLQEEGDRRRPVACALIRQVLEFCGRFGVEDDVAGAAIATRVLARGVSGQGESLADAARDALDLVRDGERRIRVLRAALATADATAYDRLDLILRMLVEEKAEEAPRRSALSDIDENGSPSTEVAKPDAGEQRRAALLRACVADAQRAARAAGGSVEARDDRAFAAPTEATLRRWIRCVAWLRAVRDDAATHLGAAGARALGARKLPFHELVVHPLKTLAPILSEQSAPFLARISQVVDDLPRGAEWIACADLVAADGVPRPRSRAEVDFYRRLDRCPNAKLAYERADALADAFAERLRAAPTDRDGLGHLKAAREAARHASRWAEADPAPAALDARAAAVKRADAAARRAAAVLFGGQSGVPDDDAVTRPGSAGLLRRLYARAADAAADQALATRGATDAFSQAAARAHRAALAVAARENDPGSAEVARRELARRWLFDDDDGTDDVHDDALAPSPLEKRDRALARAAVKVAFVLSARDGVVVHGGCPIQAALQKALDGDAATDVVVSDERGAVELLVELAAATGGPGDEADQDLEEVDAPWLDSDDDDRGEVLARRAETGERRRLTARARLRALRAAAVLSRGDRKRLEDAWKNAAKAEDAPRSLLALSRRLRVVAELSAARLPHARVVAKHGVACGVGAARFVETLLRDKGGDARLAPTLLPLLCAVLLEADDDDAVEDSATTRDARLDAADAARAPLWAALFDALAAHSLWRPLLATASRLAPRPWFRSWRAQGCDGSVKRALAAPCETLAQRAVARRRARAARTWDDDAGPAVVDDSDACAVLDDVVAVARARPSAVDAVLLAAIRDALRAFHPGALAAFDGTDAAPTTRGSSFGRRISLGPHE